MKGILSVILSFWYCFTGLASTAEIRLNPEKYNYSEVEILDVPDEVSEPDFNGYVQLEEVNMHYVKLGSGDRALVFIHGNGGSLYSLYSIASRFSGKYTVYAIDERCHGQSSDPGVITYDAMGEDIYQFCNAMNLVKPVLVGHSDGAIVAITSASVHPDYYGGIVSMGANSRPESAWFQFRFWVRWENLLQKDKLNDLMLSGPDFTEEYLGRINCPAYVVSGDADLMPVYDTYYIYSNIPDSDIKVIKGADHGSYLDDREMGYSLIYSWLESKGL